MSAETTHPDNKNIKRNIIFTLESRKKAGVPIVENVPIRMRVNFASQRIEVTTSYRIDAVKWDIDKHRVKNGSTNKLKQFEDDEVMPTPKQIKEAFNAPHRPAEEETKLFKKKKATEGSDFYKGFDEFVRDTSQQQAPSWRTLLAHYASRGE